jgi:hypothetical protein
VELSVHGGGHRLDARDLSLALRWFRAPAQSAAAP